MDWGLQVQASWTALGEAIKREDPLPLFGTGETYLDCCVQLQAPEDKKRSKLIGGSPAQGHRDDGTFSACGKAERAGAAHPREEKALGSPYSSLPVAGTA